MHNLWTWKTINMKCLPCSHLVWFSQSPRNNLNIHPHFTKTWYPCYPRSFGMNVCCKKVPSLHICPMGCEAPLPILGVVDPWSTDKMAASDCSFTTWDLQQWELTMTFLDLPEPPFDSSKRDGIVPLDSYRMHTHSFPKKRKSQTPHPRKVNKNTSNCIGKLKKIQLVIQPLS